MNTNQEPSPFQDLPTDSLPILEVLSVKEEAELARFYKLPLERAGLEADRWKRIQTGQAKTYPAWLLYDGLMYRYMSRSDLSKSEQAYLHEHVLLATGFYGLIPPSTLIYPHRLDFQGGLKIAGQSLKAYWRPAFDAAVQDQDWILSLASSEFEQIFSPAIQKRLIRITFMEEVAGQSRTHSTISKKGRGRLLSWMVRNQCQTLDHLRSAEVDGFRLDERRSTEQQLLFVRKLS